jgi:hypothetical protein
LLRRSGVWRIAQNRSEDRRRRFRWQADVRRPLRSAGAGVVVD